MVTQSLSRIDLNLLVVFDALLMEGNVTRAAARVGLAQPSASKALDRLRHLFGDPLFLRVAGGVRPTPRALELAPQVAALLEQARALLQDDLPFDPTQARGTLRVAMSDAAEFVVLPGLMALLSRQAPELRLAARPLDKDRAYQDLDEGRLDAIVGVFPDLPKRFSARDLFDEQFLCMARHDHPRLSAGLTLAAFVELPHILVTLRDDGRGAVDEALAALGHRRSIIATLSKFLSLPAILARTDAIATVPARFARSAAGCALYPPPLPVAGWTEKLIWRRGTERDPMTAWLLRLIQQAAAG